MSDSSNLQNQIQNEVFELAKSINNVVGQFRDIQRPLAESQAKVPKATRQLDKINEQTEAATQRMLDMIEQIQAREEATIDGLSHLRPQIEGKDMTHFRDLIDRLIEHANHNLDDTYTLVDNLQFQDITAQQMNHAAWLLEDIENKLRRILTVMQGYDDQGEDNDRHRERVFDPNADLVTKRTAQEDIDNLFSPKDES
ncbi:MAG TPA: protein phosphatase CheZ [candidate division Zixibacteria bacterium]|nr:protein phosphatase CheZ [candidate division Zixibacteria bacterium]